jgi:hypothetical protein
MVYDISHFAVNTSFPNCCHLEDRFKASRQIKHRPLSCQKFSLVLKRLYILLLAFGLAPAAIASPNAASSIKAAKPASLPTDWLQPITLGGGLHSWALSPGRAPGQSSDAGSAE